jgi:hypothetical protein
MLSIMSVNLSFRVGEDAITFPLAADVALLEQLRGSLPDAVAIVSDVREPGEEVAVNGAELAEAAEQLLDAIRKGGVGIPTVYCLKSPRGSTIHGGMSCNVNGRMHNFDIGLDRCSMQPTIPPYGAATDLRGQDEVQTDNGVFKIVRNVKAAELRRMLRGVRDFARRHRAEEVFKMLG